jgi:hypothetical protein
MNRLFLIRDAKLKMYEEIHRIQDFLHHFLQE